MNAAPDGLLGRIPKNSITEVRVTLDQFKGHRFLSVREYFLSVDDGEWRPTKKGCTVPFDSIPSFIEVLEALKDAIM